MTEHANQTTEEKSQEVIANFAKELRFEIDPADGMLVFQSWECPTIKDARDFTDEALYRFQQEQKRIYGYLDKTLLKTLEKYKIKFNREDFCEGISHKKYDAVTPRRVKDNIGDQPYFAYNVVIKVDPSQEWFLQRATQLLQDAPAIQAINDARSALLGENFRKDEPVIKILAALQASVTGNKFTSGLRVRWHRLHADPWRFQKAVGILSARGFDANKSIIGALTL